MVMRTPMSNQTPSGKPDPGRQRRIGVGIAIGVAIGAGIGTAMHNLALGIGVGIAIGVAMGAGSRGNGKQDRE